MKDTELYQVAKKAYSDVCQAYSDAYEQALSDSKGDTTLLEGLLEEFILHLYVYNDGRWVIDAPDYLQDHRDIVSAVPAFSYGNVDDLAQELECNADWELLEVNLDV
jgi:hypothetical protein